MKAVAGEVFKSLDSSPDAAGESWVGRVRRAAAAFWLKQLFWLSANAPWLLRCAKPLFCGGAFRFSRSIREGTLSNARRLLGPEAGDARERSLAKAVLGNFYLFCHDVGRSTGLPPASLLRRIDTIDGHESYLAARAAGTGAIVVTAHMGSFEVGMAALKQHEPRIHVVFRRDSMEAFERQRSELRSRLGVIEAPVDEGWTIWIRLREALLANEVVVLQGDRVMPGQKGQRVPFLGGHMMLPSGPIKLALASGAPIIPVFTVRTPQGNVKLFIEPAIVVRAEDSHSGEAHPALLQLACVIERYVRTYPDQWLMLEPAWCEDIDPKVGAQRRSE